MKWALTLAYKCIKLQRCNVFVQKNVLFIDFDTVDEQQMVNPRLAALITMVALTQMETGAVGEEAQSDSWCEMEMKMGGVLKLEQHAIWALLIH